MSAWQIKQSVRHWPAVTERYDLEKGLNLRWGDIITTHVHTHTHTAVAPVTTQSVNRSDKQTVSRSVSHAERQPISQSVSQSVMKAGGSSVDQTVSQSVRQPISHQSVSQSVMHEGRWLISRSDRQSFSQLDRHSKTQFSIYANSVTTTGVSQYHRTWEHNRWKWIHNTSDAHKRPLHDQPEITESYGLEKDSNLHRGDATSSIPCAHIRRLLSSYKKYLFLDITLAVINAIAANTVRHSMQLLPHTGRQSMQLLPDNVTQEMQSLQTMLDRQSRQCCEHG